MADELLPVEIKSDDFQKAIQSIEQAKQLAQFAFDSGLFPDCRSPQEALTKIVAGRTLGITPMMALQKLYIVEMKNPRTGETVRRLAQTAELALYLVQKHKYKVTYAFDNRDSPTACEVTISRKDKGEFTWRFTLKDAERAGLLREGSAWTRYPQDMLFARALMGCARKFCPEALGGISYTQEELASVSLEDEIQYESTEATKTVESAAPEGETGKTLVQAALEKGAAIVPDLSKFPGVQKKFPDFSFEVCKEHNMPWEYGQCGWYHDNPRHYMYQVIKKMTDEVSREVFGFPAFDPPKKTKAGKMVQYQSEKWANLMRQLGVENWRSLEITDQLALLEDILQGRIYPQ